MSPVARIILGLIASSALSVAALLAEIHHTGNSFYRFLVWNLFLAWIPAAAALIATAAIRRNWLILAIGSSVTWLLFFPNCPYMLTDYLHLSEREYATAPAWYDALMLSGFVWTALLLGFFSLFVMQRLWTPKVGILGAWAAAIAVLAVSSVGVYLGRFVRFNSWDVLIRPRRLVHVLGHVFEDPLHRPALVAVTTFVTLFLVCVYWILFSFTRVRDDV